VKVLALDTSSAAASVAVAQNGAIVAARRFEAPRGRGAELFAVLEEMRDAWRGLDRLAVGIGPGSYNGLRVACAVAGSFQLALGCEVVVAPSVCLLPVDDEHYFATGDARGARVYWAEVRRRRLVGDVALLDAGELAQKLSLTAQPVYRVGDLPGADSLPFSSPDAAVLARLAPEIKPCPPEELAPIYLKPPHITQPRAPRR
jgi:tRNA threonylcarbamoyl adenosine modification protein YeaZ